MTSSMGLSDVDTIHSMGKTKTSEATTRRTWDERHAPAVLAKRRRRERPA